MTITILTFMDQVSAVTSISNTLITIIASSKAAISHTTLAGMNLSHHVYVPLYVVPDLPLPGLTV